MEANWPNMASSADLPSAEETTLVFHVQPSRRLVDTSGRDSRQFSGGPLGAIAQPVGHKVYENTGFRRQNI